MENLLTEITVFMSTYNGSRYLRDQINSILNQEGVHVKLVVRDDGSSDETLDILNEYVGKVVVISGINIGCEKSFLELLYSNFKSKYYAFADQDDIWVSDKLKTAIEKIGDDEFPSLYACNLMACDEKMNPIRLVYSKSMIDSTIKRSKRDFFCNMHGCTLVWNDSLQNIIHKYKPKREIAHVVWVCVIGSAVGSFYIDEKEYIFYRLHEKNVSGIAMNWWGRLRNRVKIYWGKKNPKRYEIAREILDGFSKYMDSDSSGYHTLCTIANYNSSIFNKIKLIKQPYIKEYPCMDRAFWIISILFNEF